MIRRVTMKRKRLFIPVVLGTALSVVSTLSEAQSGPIHVTAQTVQQAFIGDPANPQLGDRSITNVDLFDDSGIKVGTAAGVCTIFSVPPLDTLVECLLTFEFAKGQIISGGVAPPPTVGASGEFGILGGTGDFSKARGDSLIVVTAPDMFDVTLNLK
jgi:hypothetical protein